MTLTKIVFFSPSSYAALFLVLLPDLIFYFNTSLSSLIIMFHVVLFLFYPVWGLSLDLTVYSLDRIWKNFSHFFLISFLPPSLLTVLLLVCIELGCFCI